MSADRLQPLHLDSSALPALPGGWVWKKVEDASIAIPVGRKYDGKAVVPGGLVPVIDQSLSGVMGHHNDEPGVEASHTDPAFTFANHTCAMRWMTSPFSCIQNVFVLRGSEGLSTQYLYYATQGRVVLEEYKGHAPVFRSMFIPIAPLGEQQHIAHLLATLDDRIALLRETNATLEAIAQALFKSWFVDFDPVHAKSQGLAPAGMDEATAALFPDSFEDSALGLVPKGWRLGVVQDVANLRGGQQLSKDAFDENGRNPVFGGAGVMGRTNLTNADGFVITVGRVGAYCGRFFWHHGGAWVNNNASLIKPTNSEDSVWLYEWLRSTNIDEIKKGAAQPFVSNGDIAALKIRIPPVQVVRRFVESCDPIYRKLEQLQQQAQTLTTLRDTLLPRLISGKLRLPEAQALTEEAA
jgi:type I restriction enzyme S subunit